MDVALFVPCLVDQCSPHIGLATHRLLTDLGLSVRYPREQTCCGQPMYNSGFPNDAAALAVRFARIFSPFEYIVTPSGSCAGMVRKFYSTLPVSDPLRRDLELLSGKTYELTQFLIEVLHLDRIDASFPHRVAYHPSCHQNRELRAAEYSRTLLGGVRGLTLIDYSMSEACCGFGGAFSLLFPELSKTMGRDKLESMAAVNADYVTSTDTGCLLQLQRAGRQLRTFPKPIHLAEILTSNL